LKPFQNLLHFSFTSSREVQIQFFFKEVTVCAGCHGNNMFEVLQVGVNVESKSVHGDPPAATHYMAQIFFPILQLLNPAKLRFSW
jgi:hypothetical protein